MPREADLGWNIRVTCLAGWLAWLPGWALGPPPPGPPPGPPSPPPKPLDGQARVGRPLDFRPPPGISLKPLMDPAKVGSPLVSLPPPSFPVSFAGNSKQT